MTALELAQLIRQKQIKPEEVLGAFFKNIHKHNPHINALTWLDEEHAFAQAKLLDVKKTTDLPPFAGVPIAIKDLTEVKDWPITMGSRAVQHMRGSVDATCVKRLRDAGFIFVGRSNTPEFGILPVTENLRFGVTKNPCSPDHTAGGSSGGAAAAVASRMLPLAHASDGGGSIRIPASCCGVVGLKASRGRIPKGPILSETLHGFTTDGVITSNVADSAALLDLLAVPDLTNWYHAPSPKQTFSEQIKKKQDRLTIAFTMSNPFDVKPAKECVTAVEKAAKHFADLGHQVIDYDMNWECDGEQLGQDFIRIWATSMAYLPELNWQEFEPHNQELYHLAKSQTSYDYVQANVRLQKFSRSLVRKWRRDFDVLLTPTIAMAPPKHGWLLENYKSVEEMLWKATVMVPYSGFCNVTGLPAISLPIHRTQKDGLPVGVQIVGAPFDEAMILSLAYELEQTNA